MAWFPPTATCQFEMFSAPVTFGSSPAAVPFGLENYLEFPGGLTASSIVSGEGVPVALCGKFTLTGPGSTIDSAALVLGTDPAKPVSLAYGGGDRGGGLCARSEGGSCRAHLG